jgi:EAL domain-containing protein (putative c-di-GMP-specific phosphodiesterase class I)/ABC-type amino acid transport substrate-binding protein
MARAVPYQNGPSASAGILAICAVSWAHIAAAQDFTGQSIVFGGDLAYPPFEWESPDGPAGFDIDLEDAIAAAGGARPEHRLSNWPDAVRSLEAGDVDVLAMFHSEQREDAFLFTPPFHFVNHGIYARDDFANVTSLEELGGARVAVEELSFAHQQLEADGFPAELVLTTNTLTALEAVANGLADYAVLAAPTSNYLIRDRSLALRNVGPPLWPREYAFAVRRDRPDLATWLTDQYYAVLRNGDYQDIYARWESELAPTEEGARSRLLRFLAVPGLLLALLGLGSAWHLRRAVVARTRIWRAEIERRRSAEAEAQWAKDHDEQTALPRLQPFSSWVGELIANADTRLDDRKQVVALKLADLDRTVRTLGHESAQAAMNEFARAIREMRFPACGQTGRDVFLVFGDVAHIARALQRQINPSDTIVMEGTTVPRLFAGAATWPDDGVTLPELLRKAETALAVAIEKREAWVGYRPSMEPDEADLELLRLFRESGGAGLRSVYQPQLDLRSGGITAAEALVRWDPGTGPIAPDKFIPLLEDAGLIRHVTIRMLKESIAVAARLRRAGTPCPISVNVAVSDLLTEKTQKVIFKALDAESAVPADIKLELTETGVADSPEVVRWVMSRLTDSGISISIDDFGTGYAALSYLSEFPIRQVKIDRIFIADMLRNKKSDSIVRSTIAMAHELGLEVVAEGVETQDQMHMLIDHACDLVQGYLISRPLEEAALVEFLRLHCRSPVDTFLDAAVAGGDRA